MRGREPVPLLIGTSELPLEVEHHPFDLDVDDLCRAEEPDIDRLTVWSGGDLKLRSPRRTSQSHQVPREVQLPAVAQRWLATGVSLDDDVQADRGPNRA